MQSTSHDWHRYLWIFQSTDWWYPFVHGLIGGLLLAVVVVPATVVVGVALFAIYPTAREGVIAWNIRKFYVRLAIVWLAGGVLATLILGRNPGVM